MRNKIETDISKLIEEAAKGNKKMISPTQILVTCAVYDLRFDVEFMNNYGFKRTRVYKRRVYIGSFGFFGLFCI